jgi:hypothetical protein
MSQNVSNLASRLKSLLLHTLLAIATDLQPVGASRRMTDERLFINCLQAK